MVASLYKISHSYLATSSWLYLLNNKVKFMPSGLHKIYLQMLIRQGFHYLSEKCIVLSPLKQVIQWFHIQTLYICGSQSWIYQWTYLESLFLISHSHQKQILKRSPPKYQSTGFVNLSGGKCTVLDRGNYFGLHLATPFDFTQESLTLLQKWVDLEKYPLTIFL